jgi:hypothetical protein
MNTYERTALAVVVCLALVVVALWLFITNFEWPTSRLGRPPSEREILVNDVLPIVVAGFVIGLVAIAITRFIFPKSSMKAILFAATGCAALATLPFLLLSNAIGAGNIRDYGTIAMFFAAPLAIATWAAISSYRSSPKGG